MHFELKSHCINSTGSKKQNPGLQRDVPLVHTSSVWLYKSCNLNCTVSQHSLESGVLGILTTKGKCGSDHSGWGGEQNWSLLSEQMLQLLGYYIKGKHCYHFYLLQLYFLMEVAAVLTTVLPSQVRHGESSSTGLVPLGDSDMDMSGF